MTARKFLPCLFPKAIYVSEMDEVPRYISLNQPVVEAQDMRSQGTAAAVELVIDSGLPVSIALASFHGSMQDQPFTIILGIETEEPAPTNKISPVVLEL